MSYVTNYELALQVCSKNAIKINMKKSKGVGLANWGTRVCIGQTGALGELVHLANLH